MAHRLAPQVEFELDEIWFYIAGESGSEEIADRLIDSITDRFFLLSNHPYVGRRRDLSAERCRHINGRGHRCRMLVGGPEEGLCPLHLGRLQAERARNDETVAELPSTKSDFTAPSTSFRKLACVSSELTS